MTGGQANRNMKSEFVSANAREPMARPTSPTLTPAELRLMNVLWERGSGSATEIAGALAEEDVDRADSSVRTILGILEEKGYVASELRGRSRVFTPVISRAEARRTALRYFLTRFFDGSREELLLNLLDDAEVDAAELARLKQLLREGGEDAD